MSKQSVDELMRLSNHRFDAGDFHGSINWAEQAEVCARQQDEQYQELRAIAQQAAGWSNLGDLKKALEVATRLIDRARRYGEEEYLVKGTRLFAGSAADIDVRNRWREIRPILLEGLQVARRIGSEKEEIDHLRSLGEYATLVGELDQGYAWLQEALNTLQPSTSEFVLFFRCQISIGLSMLMRKRNNYVEARRFAELAIGAAREEGNPGFIFECQLELAWVEREDGELAEALKLTDEALGEVRRMRWKRPEQMTEYLRGELLRELGYAKRAEEAARRALELAREIQIKEGEVESLLSWGQALLALGRKEEARDALKQAKRLSQERDYADHFQKAEELLVANGSL